MSGVADVHGGTKKILMVVSNPAPSQQTGWPIGFWWAELTHPYWELVEHGYAVDIASPEGGRLERDKWSDPRDSTGCGKPVDELHRRVAVRVTRRSRRPPDHRSAAVLGRCGRPLDHRGARSLNRGA